ncbi:hypothetical protein J2S78_000818 [Salibacterium salarium]|uniref:hypothetical protein n=1 Tax=Salibacterium salarium TaxID=284579 RepID=UPI00278A420C|nr:hypothetical protein [Salibacterium salarium]MDQ0298410.1 hypothetical protein [Salibacterium salarium]
MKLIPFENTWPYEKMGEDIYIEECPYCKETNVLTYMKEEHLQQAKDGIKTRVVMPCCHATMIVADADDDYFWTTERLR